MDTVNSVRLFEKRSKDNFEEEIHQDFSTNCEWHNEIEQAPSRGQRQAFFSI